MKPMFLEKSLGMFFGMFAFVLFDRQAGELILVRDRIGQKPLYFGWQGNTFLFGSELKALRVHPDLMMKNVELTNGLVFSQRVLLALIESGLRRERAYEIIQNCAMESWDNGSDFRKLIFDENDVMESLDKSVRDSIFDYNYYTKHVDETFARLGIEG